MSKAVTKFYVEELGAVVVPIVDRCQRDEPGTLSRTNSDCKANSSGFSNECEIEAENKDSNMPRSPYDATGRVENPRNVYITDRQYRNSLTTDWSNTLNVSTMSDVVVLVDKNHIWAHKLVFHVRCSDLLLDCQPIDDKRFRHVKEKISWPDIDYLTALAFLEFVYSGVIVKNEHVFSDDRIAALVRSLARKYRLKDLFEYMRNRKSEIEAHSEESEDRITGLRSPIVIEVARRDRNIETVPNETELAVEKEMSTPSTFSLDQKSRIMDLTDAKTPDVDVQSIEDDVLSIDTEPTGDRNRSITSPDIFDDTTEEAMDDVETNSLEAAEASARLSANENSNLRVLAQLIAEDDLSRPDEGNDSDASSTASTFIDDGLSKECTAAKQTDKKSTSAQSQSETPRTRGSSMSNRTKIIDTGKKSMTQRLQGKPKSNLSIFIEKIQKINAKSFLDSYTEEESLGEPYDRGRLRNPFNVKNESNRSISDDEGKTEDGRLMDGKGVLSALEEDLLLRHGKKNINVGLQSADETADFDDASSMGNSNLEENTEDGQLMGENGPNSALEEESGLNRWKNDENVDLKSANKSGRFNESSSMVNLDLEDSTILENAASTDDENMSMYSRYKKTHKHNNSINKYRSLLIKLTEASAATSQDDDKRDDSSQRVDEAIDLTQESDSEIESSPSFNVAHSRKRSSIRAIASDSNESSNLREKDGKKCKSAGNQSDLVVSSDDVDDDSFDDAESPTPVSKRSISQERGMNMRSPVARSFDQRKNFSTSPEYPDSRVREADEEIFTQSLKRRRTLTPTVSAETAEKSVAESSKRRSEISRSYELSFEDDLKKNEESHRENRSSKGKEGLSHSSQYPDLDVFEVDEDLFAESFGSPRRPSSSKSESSSSKRRIGEGGAEDIANHSEKDGEDKKEEEEEQLSPRTREKRRSSPHYSDFDAFEVNDQVFTQSFRSPSASPRGALTHSPRFGTANDDQRGRNGTLRVPSPIVISSSPEMEPHSDIPATNTEDSNKENSSILAEDNAGLLYSGKNSLSISNLASPSSPEPGPSRRGFSPECGGISATPARKSLQRWNSMPTSTTSTQRLKRTRSPKKPSRIALSQGVTPPVNYDAMDTPELKVTTKYRSRRP